MAKDQRLGVRNGAGRAFQHLAPDLRFDRFQASRAFGDKVRKAKRLASRPSKRAAVSIRRRAVAKPSFWMTKGEICAGDRPMAVSVMANFALGLADDHVGAARQAEAACHRCALDQRRSPPAAWC